MTQLSHQCSSLYERAVDSLRKGDIKVAAHCCETLCKEFPRFAPGWYIASSVAQHLNNFDKALEFIDRAIDLGEDELFFKLRKAHILLNMGRRGQAAEIADDIGKHCISKQGTGKQSIDKQSSSDGRMLSELGKFYLLAEQFPAAVDYLQRALQIDPKSAGNWFHLASVLRFLGRLDEAEEAYDNGLKHNPRFYEAYYIRAGLRRQTAGANHIEELTALLEDDIDAPGEVRVCYALGKEYEDLRDYDRAFHYLKRAGDLRRRLMQYDVADDVTGMQAIIDTYSAPVMAQAHTGCDSEQPIFIIGLPRSGTTLVERVLGSHSDVVSAGELNNFAVEMMKLVQQDTVENEGKQKKPLSKIDSIHASVNIDFASLGANYLSSIGPLIDTPPGSINKKVIDKMPLNFLYAGLIAKALPRAKIIELVRHPLDVCYAIYKQFFISAYPFSYNLDELAQYYLAYRQLINHWHTVLPGRIHRVFYEDMVDNQQRETQALLNYCGLPWQDACLDFTANHSASTTASAAQIREPIYRTSVEKWREVKDHLAPVMERLRGRELLWSESGRYSLD